MKVRKIYYNWHQVGSVQDRDGCGEDWEEHEIGKGVDRIEEHRPSGEGDKWFYDVFVGERLMTRIFNINQVEYVS